MPVKQTDILLVYGLKNCDSCKKAQAWLKAHGVKYEFRDVRIDGVETERLQRWILSPFADLLTNRRSTTWRGLSANEKALSESEPLKVLSKHLSLIKRPVVERHGRVLAVGFSPDDFRKHLLS